MTQRDLNTIALFEWLGISEDELLASELEVRDEMFRLYGITLPFG